MNISQCPFLVSYSYFFGYDLPCSKSVVVPACPLCPSTPFLHGMLCTGHISVLSSYATPEFPMSDCSCDEQTCVLSFVPCQALLSGRPCKDPSTRPRIQESVELVTCRLVFEYYYF